MESPSSEGISRKSISPLLTNSFNIFLYQFSPFRSYYPLCSNSPVRFLNLSYYETVSCEIFRRQFFHFKTTQISDNKNGLFGDILLVHSFWDISVTREIDVFKQTTQKSHLQSMCKENNIYKWTIRKIHYIQVKFTPSDH